MSRTDKRNIDINETFVCAECGRTVNPAVSGTHNRNHCPYCLCSNHADIRIGDRRSLCRGIMEPIGIWVREKGEWMLIHRCRKCGFIRTNRIAPDDNELLLFSLAARALSSLPFPSKRVLDQLNGQIKENCIYE